MDRTEEISIYSPHLEELLASRFPDNSPPASDGRESGQQPEERKRSKDWWFKKYELQADNQCSTARSG